MGSLNARASQKKVWTFGLKGRGESSKLTLMRKEWLLLLFVSSLIISGCGEGDALQVVAETDETTYRRAEQYLREDRFDEALAAYLRVIEERLRKDISAPDSHLAAGQLYLEHVDDPVAAIYHFREYLRLRPDAPQADKVEGLIRTARKRFAQNLPGQPYQQSIDRTDLMDLLKQVREENLRLKERLAHAEQRLNAAGYGALDQAVPPGADRAGDSNFYAPPPQQPPQQQRQPASTVPSTYTVERGDSLYRISTRVYGTGAHWKKLFEANRDQLSSPQALKPGMVLNIPPNP